MPTENNGGNSGSTHGGIENLKPWPKGVSGNPSGRPRKTPLTDACRDVLAQAIPSDPTGRTYAEAIALTLAKKAVEGDIRAAQEIADRAEGKPRQSLEVENTTLGQAFKRMTSSELLAYATSGALPDWFPKSENASESIQ